MNRLHVSLTVADLDASIDFYTTLLGAEPSVRKPDYARWMLDDPRVNFAIDTGGEGVPGAASAGFSHLGLQAEDEAELDVNLARVAAAGGPTLDEGETTCCYARSTKQWIADPDGVPWEVFLTHEDAPVHGRRPAPTTEDEAPRAIAGSAAVKPTAAGGGCC